MQYTHTQTTPDHPLSHVQGVIITGTSMLIDHQRLLHDTNQITYTTEIWDGCKTISENICGTRI